MLRSHLFQEDNARERESNAQLISELEIQRSELEIQRQALVAAHGESDRLGVEVDSLRSECEALAESMELLRLKSEAELAAQRTRANAATAEEERLRKQLQEGRDAADAAAAAAARRDGLWRKRVAAAERRVAEEASAHAETRASLERRCEAEARVRRRSAALRGGFEKRASELERGAERALEETQRELEKTQHEVAKMEQELVEERGRAKRARRRHARSLKEMSKLRSDLAAAEMRAATATELASQQYSASAALGLVEAGLVDPAGQRNGRRHKTARDKARRDKERQYDKNLERQLRKRERELKEQLLRRAEVDAATMRGAATSAAAKNSAAASYAAMVDDSPVAGAFARTPAGGFRLRGAGVTPVGLGVGASPGASLSWLGSELGGAPSVGVGTSVGTGVDTSLLAAELSRARSSHTAKRPTDDRRQPAGDRAQHTRRGSAPREPSARRSLDASMRHEAVDRPVAEAMSRRQSAETSFTALTDARAATHPKLRDYRAEAVAAGRTAAAKASQTASESASPWPAESHPWSIPRELREDTMRMAAKMKDYRSRPSDASSLSSLSSLGESLLSDDSDYND